MPSTDPGDTDRISAGGGDWPPLSAWKTGISGRCPRCGQGRLFDGYLKVTERCSVCGLDLRAHDSGDGPAVFIIFILGFIVVPLAVWTEFTFEPPLWVHAILWTVVILAGTFGLLRPLKGIMVALQYRHRSTAADSNLD